jgi:rhodanese-related sulfurtransferase
MTSSPQAPADVPGVDVVGALAAVADGATLLDVRELNEWEAGHAPQAVHVPLSQVPASLASIPQGRPVVVVCRSGRRSTFAVAALLQAGIDAVNLDGGMQAWHQAGGSVVAAPGITPAVI